MNLGKLECLSKSRNCPTTRPLTFVNKGRKKRKKEKNNRGEEKLWKLSTPRNDGIIQKEFSSRIKRFIKQGGLFPRTNLEPTKGPPFDDRSTLIDRLAVRSIDDARIDLEVTAEGDQRTERYPSSSPPPAKHRWMVYGCGFVEGDHRPRIIHSAVFRCARASHSADPSYRSRERVGWRVVTIGPVVVLRLMFLHLSSMGKKSTAWWSVPVSCFSAEK